MSGIRTDEVSLTPFLSPYHPSPPSPSLEQPSQSTHLLVDLLPHLLVLYSKDSLLVVLVDEGDRGWGASLLSLFSLVGRVRARRGRPVRDPRRGPTCGHREWGGEDRSNRGPRSREGQGRARHWTRGGRTLRGRRTINTTRTSRPQFRPSSPAWTPPGSTTIGPISQHKHLTLST